MAYATGAADLTRLGIGTRNQLVRTNSGTTAPEWASLADILALSSGAVETASDVVSDNTWNDPTTGDPGPTVTITTGAAGIIMAWAKAGVKSSSATGHCFVGIGFAGSDPSAKAKGSIYGPDADHVETIPVTVSDNFTAFTSVAVKMLYLSDGGGSSLNVRERSLFVMSY